MPITKASLHLPPFISTAWRNILSLHMEQEEDERLLVVTLVNGSQICIPNLEERLIRQIFLSHGRHLEEECGVQSPSAEAAKSTSLKVHWGEGSTLGSIAQHNPELSDAPDLPAELLQRVRQVTRVMAADFLEQLPQAEEGCNCYFCQIHRAIHISPDSSEGEERQLGESGEEEGEPVGDEELQFRSWEVAHEGEKLYLVTNSQDPTESYRVYLGEPLGCTCGVSQCEHIRAVLYS